MEREGERRGGDARSAGGDDRSVEIDPGEGLRQRRAPLIGAVRLEEARIMEVVRARDMTGGGAVRIALRDGEAVWLSWVDNLLGMCSSARRASRPTFAWLT